VFLHVKTHHLSGGAQKAPYASVLLAALLMYCHGTGRREWLEKRQLLDQMVDWKEESIKQKQMEISCVSKHIFTIHLKI
jgi:hypothetical protein